MFKDRTAKPCRTRQRRSEMERMTIAGLVFVACFFVFVGSAFAQDEGGIEYNVNLISDTYVHPQIAVNGELDVLYNIYDEAPSAMLYAGARFDVANWYSTYVRLGVTADVPVRDLIGLDVSLVQSVRLFDGMAELFLQTDLIFHQEGFTYYGLYRFSMMQDWFNFGVTTEQVQNVVNLGPHVGVNAGPVSLEVQLFTELSESPALTVRTVLEVAFAGGRRGEAEEEGEEEGE